MIRKALIVLLMLTSSLPLLRAQEVDMTLFHGMRPRNIGPAGFSGRVTALAADPRNYDLFYVGTASGGLWKTENAGTTFTPVFDDERVASIGAIAIDPQRPDVIWAGTGEGNPRNSLNCGAGIYKSLDQGRTWQLMGLEATSNIYRILINPNNTDIVYVGAIGNPWGPNEDRGLYKTTDGGKTWKKILYNGPTVGVSDMVMDPSNPDKLFVGMWNHQRWPWFFNSGGEGSGLYMTLDGGETFTRILNPIPEESGRIGLAIPRNHPDYVYAYVEGRPTAIYRSTDGGFTWSQRGTQGIGNRPFYYGQIHADPHNENRIYTLYTNLAMSEDGGLTFPFRLAPRIHVDFHAFWVNPDNPRHLIIGNDGGMAISYDLGRNWRHISNLPVSQFYHINVDMEVPYNVYGGLQDNGSWVGPGYTWRSGGIINEEWELLGGGDGFDAMPVPGDPRYCYYQSQGGNLRRVDLVTGASVGIRPRPTSGERLRFNWNSGLAQDPFDNNTIYFGSQHLHKSIDRGDNWEIISPDLSTNDPEKQRFGQSGGLTRDATGAEVHTTILTISPSPVQKGVIWVGTDDGNVQVTRDGGETWTNTAPSMRGAPKNAWIPQITASQHNAAEAFVVLNNYRVGDNSAHLYHTKDYGRSWERIIDDSKVWGYVICFAQDPIEPRLMFAGTEYHLYVSFDGGKVWNKWEVGYPTVSTYDMVIHPREHDLVIATFGRSIWVLDDIRPLREVARTNGAALNKKIVSVDAPDGYMVNRRGNPGYYPPYYGDSYYMGENRQSFGRLNALVGIDTDERVTIEILNDSDVVIHSFEANVRKGLNRILWRYNRDPLPLAGATGALGQAAGRLAGMQGGGGGGTVLPGTYKVRMTLDGESSLSEITVHADPRNEVVDISLLKANMALTERFAPMVSSLNELYEKFRECNEILNSVDEYARENSSVADAIRATQSTMRDKYNSSDRALSTRPEGLFAKINTYRTIAALNRELTVEEKNSINQIPENIDQASTMLRDFLEKEWPTYMESMRRASVPEEVLRR